MTEKKITKRENFESIKGILAEIGRTDLVKVMEHEIELLDKKKTSKSKKDVERAKFDEKLIEGLLTEMETNRLYTVTEMLKELQACKDYEIYSGDILSNQRLSRIVTTLSKEGTLERVESKGRAYFKVVRG